MKRIGVLFLLLAAILLVVPAAAAPPVHHATPWWHYDLKFWAPFDDVRSPLRLLRGTGSLTFTRATTATYVHPTTGLITTAADNVLRIESNGALIEGQRTNLLTYSEEITLTSWPQQDYVTIINDNILAPDGTITADRVAEDNTTHIHRIYRIETVSLSTDYTFSVFLKKGTNRFAQIMMMGEPQIRLSIDFDTLDTLSTDATKSGVIAYDNGWYRLWASTSSGTGVGTNLFLFVSLKNSLEVNETSPSYLGVGDYTYVWGAQSEVGTFSSSYIPTVAAAVTRNASVLTEQTAGNIDNVDGTLALQWSPRYASTVAVGTAVLFDAGGVKATYTSADRKINFTDGTNTVSSAALTFSANVAQKLAFRWGPSGLLVYKDGSEAATGATYTAPTLNANLYIGTDTSSANSAYSNIKPVRTWNRAFTDVEMQSITR